jgi:hypothetical protein
MDKRQTIFRLIPAAAVFLVLACQHATEPGKSRVTLSGTVYPAQPGSPAIQSAYLFMGDSLMAVTDETGHYHIASIESGSHDFICSALGYSDATVEVTVGRENTLHDFYLTPDESTGRVYAEFQDQTLWLDALADHPELDTWNDRELFEGTTGATLQTKWLQIELPDRILFLGDSLLAYSDGFGQCWAKLQCGTYPLTGVCEGYRSVTRTVHIVPYAPPESEKSYVIFFMNRLEKQT